MRLGVSTTDGLKAQRRHKSTAKGLRESQLTRALPYTCATASLEECTGNYEEDDERDARATRTMPLRTPLPTDASGRDKHLFTMRNQRGPGHPIIERTSLK